ncbi:MAG: sigma-70 family RNA polymerase sigma factor [Planctomycetota bacterium]|jgi:RNA polymerase sigma-70 factor (ECF subfamily)
MRSEEKLVADFAKRGDRSAFEEIVRRRAGFVFNIALGVLQDRGLAEDATQDAFLALLQSPGAFKGTGSFRAWLGRVAHNRALDILRSRKRRVEREQQVAVHPVEGGREMEDGTGVNLVGLKGMVMNLPRDLRTPVIMKYFQKITLEEIGEILEVSKSTVSNRIQEARRHLKEGLLKAGLASMVPGIETHLFTLEGDAVSQGLLETLVSLGSTGKAGLLVAESLALSKNVKAGIVGLALLSVSALTVFLASVFFDLPWLGLSGGKEESALGTATPSSPDLLPGENEGGGRGDGRESAEGKRGVGTNLPISKGLERTDVPRGISGRVLDVEGNPVEGARVALMLECVLPSRSKAGGWESYRMHRTREETLGEEITDRGGRFIFPAPKANAGPLSLRATVEGYAETFVHDVKEDEPLEVVLVERAVELTGRIETVQKAPVEGVSILAVRSVSGTSFLDDRVYFEKFRTESDRDGRFRLKGLSPGKYMVYGIREGFATALNKWVIVPRVREVVFQLTEGVALVGKVLDDETHRPVVGAEVLAATARGLERARTDDEGRYRIEHLVDQARRGLSVTITAPGYMALSTSLLGLGKDGVGRVLAKDFRMRRGIAVAGRVVDGGTGAPMKGARVLSPGAGYGLRGGDVEVQTGPDGAFLLEGVSLHPLRNAPPTHERYPPRGEGMLRVYVRLPGWFQTGPTEVEVRPGKGRVAGIRIPLSPGRLVSGRVIDEAGNPLEGARVQFSPWGSPGFMRDFPQRGPERCLSDAEGTFSLRLPPGGPAVLGVFHSGFAFAFHEVGSSPGGDRVIRLREGGAIEGVAKAENGETLAFKTIRCRFLDEAALRLPSPWSAWGTDPFRREVRTDKEGRFTMHHLIPGLWDLIHIETRMEQAVWVREGARTVVHFWPESGDGFTIEGILVDDSGNPLNSRGVIEARFVGGRFHRSTRFESGGAFRLAGLPEGDYRLRVFRCGGEIHDHEEIIVPAGTVGLRVVIREQQRPEKNPK